MSKKIMYKFSITNLILVNSVYPFDFFLRVHTANAEQPQDSPLIQANSFQCDQLFPWQFAVSSTKLNVQFIEISKGENEIVKSQIVIGNTTTDDGETVAMLAARTAKKICLITYKLQPYTQIEVNSSRSKVKNKSPNHFHDNWDPTIDKSSPKKQNKITFSKQQHDQLSKQIANINKSIDKILDNEKSQHAIFNKYLQQSTSFIKQVLNQSKMNKTNSYRMNDIQQQEEEKGNVSSILKQVRQQNQSPYTSHDTSNIFKDQVNLNSWKWYRDKFNKDKPRISKNVNYRKQSDRGVIAAVIQPSLQYSLQYSKDNSDDQISLLLSEISVNSELKPSQISFLEPKDEKLILKMSSPNGPSYEWKKPIQLPKIDTVLISIADLNNKNYIKGCIAKKQFQKQRVSLYDINGTQKGFMKFKAKILGTISVQTHQLLNSSQLDASKIQHSNDYSKQIQKPEQLQEKEQEIQKEQKIQIQKQVQLQNKVIDKQQQKQSSPRQDKEENSKQLQKIYKLDKVQPFKRPSRIRRRSIDEDENKQSVMPSQKQQMENKEQHREQNKSPKANKFQFVSNSVSASFLPFMKKYSISQRFDRTPFMSDQQLSDIASSQSLSRIKLVNFKVDSVSVKIITKNTNDYVGKFIKLRMRNKTPYITETINLSQNLTWRGKGFIFQNASPYAQLIIQLFNEQKNQHLMIGKAKICLALLNLQKPNEVQIYSDYIRDQDQNQIAQLILGYESLDKQKSKSNSLKRKKKLQLEDIQVNHEQNKKKKNKSRVRNKSQDLHQQMSRYNTEKPKAIGMQGSQAKSIVGSTSVIRSKKYSGGNIIIGRAARFRAKNPNLPGPGEYEMPSGFERHVVPL